MDFRERFKDILTKEALDNMKMKTIVREGKPECRKTTKRDRLFPQNLNYFRVVDKTKLMWIPENDTCDIRNCSFGKRKDYRFEITNLVDIGFQYCFIEIDCVACPSNEIVVEPIRVCLVYRDERRKMFVLSVINRECFTDRPDSLSPLRYFLKGELVLDEIKEKKWKINPTVFPFPDGHLFIDVSTLKRAYENSDIFAVYFNGRLGCVIFRDNHFSHILKKSATVYGNGFLRVSSDSCFNNITYYEGKIIDGSTRRTKKGKEGQLKLFPHQIYPSLQSTNFALIDSLLDIIVNFEENGCNFEKNLIASFSVVVSNLREGRKILNTETKFQIHQSLRLMSREFQKLYLTLFFGSYMCFNSVIFGYFDFLIIARILSFLSEFDVFLSSYPFLYYSYYSDCLKEECFRTPKYVLSIEEMDLLILNNIEKPLKEAVVSSNYLFEIWYFMNKVCNGQLTDEVFTDRNYLPVLIEISSIVFKNLRIARKDYPADEKNEISHCSYG